MRQETWPLAKGVSAFAFGTCACPEEAEYNFIYDKLKEHCKKLNNALGKKQWLVGDCMTVADLELALGVMELLQCVIDTNTKNSLNNLNAHFKRVCESDVFVGRMGHVKTTKIQI